MAIKNYVIKNKRKSTCILSVMMCMIIALFVFIQTNNTNAGVFIKDGDKNVQIYEINILEIVAVDGQQTLGYTIKGQEPITIEKIEAYHGLLTSEERTELGKITGYDIEYAYKGMHTYTATRTDFNNSFNQNVLGDSMAEGEIVVRAVPANELSKEDIEWARLIYINDGSTSANLLYYYDQIMCGGANGYVKGNYGNNYTSSSVDNALRKDIAEKKIVQAAGNSSLAKQLTKEDFISLNITVDENDESYINIFEAASSLYIESIIQCEQEGLNASEGVTSRKKIADLINKVNDNLTINTFEVIKNLAGTSLVSEESKKQEFISALYSGGWEGYNPANDDAYCEKIEEYSVIMNESELNLFINSVNNEQATDALSSLVLMKEKNYDTLTEEDKNLLAQCFRTVNVGDVKEVLIDKYIQEFYNEGFIYKNSDSEAIMSLVNSVNDAEYDRILSDLEDSYESGSFDIFIEKAELNFEILAIDNYYSWLLDEYISRLNNIANDSVNAVTDIDTLKANVIDYVNASKTNYTISYDMTWTNANSIYTKAMNEEVALMYNTELLTGNRKVGNYLAESDTLFDNKNNVYKMLLLSRLLQYDYYKTNVKDKIDSNGLYYPDGYDSATGEFIGKAKESWFRETFSKDFSEDYDNYSIFREPDVVGTTYKAPNVIGADKNYVYKRIYSFTGSQFLSGEKFISDNFTSKSTASNLGDGSALGTDNTLESSTLFKEKTIGDVIRYILGVSLMEVRTPIRVLEIQPTTHSSKFNSLQGAQLLYQYLGLNPNVLNKDNWNDNVSVTAVSVREFNTRNEDLTSNYDLIYIGAQNTAFYQKGLTTSKGKAIYRTDFIDNTLDGKVYFGIGDTINVASKLGGIASEDYNVTNSSLSDLQKFDNSLWKEYFFAALEDDGLDKNKNYLLKNSSSGITTRLLGNDITVKRMEELLTYLKAGYPVMLADEIFYCDYDNELYDNKYYNEPTYGTTQGLKYRIYYKVSGSSESKVYFYNSNNWSKPYVYVWKGDTKYSGSWPGTPMTSIGNGWYSFDCNMSDKSGLKVIFNNNSGSQTGDLDLVINGEYNANGYTNNVRGGGSGPSDNLYVYMWSETSGHKYAGDWPGTQMKSLGNGLYYYDYNQQLSESSTKVIFSSNGNNQTADLGFHNYGYYESGKYKNVYTPESRDYETRYDASNVEKWAYVDKYSKLYNFVVEAKKLGYDKDIGDYTGLAKVTDASGNFVTDDNGNYITEKVFNDDKVYPSLVREGNINFIDYSNATTYSAETGGNPDNLEGFKRLEGGLRFAYKRIDYVDFEYDDSDYALKPKKYEELQTDSYIKNDVTKYNIKLKINSSVTVEEMEKNYSYMLYLDKSGVGKFDDRYTLEIEPDYKYESDKYGNVVSVTLSGNWPKNMEGFIPWKIEAYKKSNPEVKFSYQSYSVFENEETGKKDVYVLWVRTQYPEWWGRDYDSTALEFANAVNSYASQILDYNIHIFTISYYDFNRLYGMHDKYYETSTFVDKELSFGKNGDQIDNGSTKLKVSTLIEEYYKSNYNMDNKIYETNTYHIELPAQIKNTKNIKDKNDVISYFYDDDANTDDKMTEEEYSTKELDMLVLGFSDSYDLSQHPDGQGYNNYRKYLDVRSIYGLKDIEYFIDAGHSLLYAHDNSSAVSTMMDYFTANRDERAMGWAKYNTLFLRERLGQDTYGVTLDDDFMTDSANNARMYIDPNKQNNADFRGFTEVTTFRYQQDVNRTYSIYGKGSNLTEYYDVDPRPDQEGWADKDSWRYTQMAKKVNVGQITEYPFVIPNKIGIALTHAQYNTLDLEDEDTTVWYTLDYDDTATGNNIDSKKNSKLYDYTSGDGANNYYIYTNGNITYTGAGHERISDKGNEIELFINTLIAALKAGNYQPEIELPNAYQDDNKNNFINFSNDSDSNSDKATIDFIPIDYDYKNGYKAFSSCRIYVDLNGNNSYDEKTDLMLMDGKNESIYLTDELGNYICINGTELLNRETKTFYITEADMEKINSDIGTGEIFDYKIVIEVVDNGNSEGKNMFTARNSFKLVKKEKPSPTEPLNPEDFNLN